MKWALYGLSESQKRVCSIDVNATLSQSALVLKDRSLMKPPAWPTLLPLVLSSSASSTQRGLEPFPGDLQPALDVALAAAPRGSVASLGLFQG